jgi:hypothetical protein
MLRMRPPSGWSLSESAFDSSIAKKSATIPVSFFDSMTSMQ